MDLDKFIKENCMMCGTQRCDPSDIEWLEGCTLYQEEKKKEIEKVCGGSLKDRQ